MRFIKTPLVILLALTSLKAFAIRAGNGGDAFVCFNSTQAKKSVYDVILKNRKLPIELKEDPFQNIDFDKDISKVETLEEYMIKNMLEEDTYAELTEKEIVDQFILKIKGINSFGDSIKKILNNDLRASRWMPSFGGVIEINDSAHKIIAPKNCLLVQVALNEKIGNKFRVYYEKRLFVKMGAMSKASLRLHEGIYALMSHQVTNSVPVRDLIVSTFLNDLDVQELHEMLNSYNIENKRKNFLLDIFDQQVVADELSDERYKIKGKLNFKDDLGVNLDLNGKIVDLKNKRLITNSEVNVPNLLTFKNLVKGNVLYGYDDYYSRYLTMNKAKNGQINFLKSILEIDLSKLNKHFTIYFSENLKGGIEVGEIRNVTIESVNLSKLGIEEVKYKKQISRIEFDKEGKLELIRFHNSDNRFECDVTINGKTYNKVYYVAFENDVPVGVRVEKRNSRDDYISLK